MCMYQQHTWICKTFFKLLLRDSVHVTQVDTKVEGKTGLLVATAEGWAEVVTALIDSKAAVDEPVQNALSQLYSVHFVLLYYNVHVQVHACTCTCI